MPLGNSYHMLIISPSLLEPCTRRGGGIEEIDCQIASKLSEKVGVIIVGPYYGGEKITKANSNFLIYRVLFPAMRHYPPRNNFEKSLLTLIVEPIYTLILGLTVLNLTWKYDPKIILVHNGFPGFICTVIGRLMSKKLIYSEGNLSPWVDLYIDGTNISFAQKVIRLMHLAIGKCIAVSADTIRVQSSLIKSGMMKNGIDPDKILIIGGGVDTNVFHPLDGLNLSSKEFRIGFIGRLTEEKGVLLLIQVVKDAIDYIPDAEFYILGDGPYRNTLEKFSNVKHVGAVPRSQLNQWFSQLHCVLFFQKDIGLAEIESMAAGKVLVAMDGEDMSKVIEHLNNGILCEPNASSYIQFLEKLHGDPSLCRKLSVNARKYAVDNFSWDNLSRQWLTVISKYI